MMATLTQAQSLYVSSFSPVSGTPGSVVALTGTGFSTVADENVVYFGPVRGSVTFATETELHVIVPPAATSSAIVVTVQGLTAYTRSRFIVTFPFSGNITGSFQNRTDLPVGYQMKWETVSDIDGDGKTDIVFVDEGYGAAVVLRNASTPGTITWNSFETAGFFFTASAPYAVATGDLDGDSKPDLVVANNQSSSVSVLRNISSPGFVDFEPPKDFTTMLNPVFIAVRDIDLDGKPDIALACNNNYQEGFITVLRNTTSAGSISADAFQQQTYLPAGQGGVWFVGLEDLDDDSKPDIIASSGSDGHISIFKNISSAGSISPESFEPKVDFVTGPYPAIVAVADLDSDGRSDLAVGNQDGDFISLFRNTSSPGIIDASSFENSGSLPSSDPWNTTAGDLDGDGKPELIVRRPHGLLSVFRNKSLPGTLSNEAFSSPYTLSTDGSSLGISIADMDGDGKSDLVLSNEVTNVISVFRNEDLFIHSGPGGLTFTGITGTSLTVHVAPSPDQTDGYITLRRIGAFPDHPQDGETYVDGQQIGEDVVAHIGTETSLEEVGLTPGTDYFYRSYAYSGGGSSIDYHTARWAADVGFTIGPDLGPIVVISPETFSMDDEITITFDATRSHPVNALLGATSIRMRSGIITDSPDGTTWHPNHINAIDLAATGDDKWTCTFTPRIFYNFVPRDLKVYRLAMIFSDEELDHGLSFDGKPIYATVSPTVLRPPITLPAAFVSSSGFEASWKGFFDISEYYLDVSTSPSFESFVDGYENRFTQGWETIRARVSGLSPETQYYYRVRVAGLAESSSVISTRTASIPIGGSKNIWVQNHGGPGNEEIQAMTSDEKGNVYAAGHFTGTVSFGSITLCSQGEFDLFFVKYDKHGRVVWARSLGGPALDNEVSLATDSEGLYMTAQFQGETDLDPGPGTTMFFNEGEWWVNDAFIAKYSVEDGSLLWAHKIVDAFGWSSAAIAVDRSGIYFSGQFFGKTDFDPSANEIILESKGDYDIFIAKYSLNGRAIWARGLGGYYLDASWGVTADKSGLFVHGLYDWQCDFDPGDDYYYLDNSGGFFGQYDLHTGDLVYAKSVGNGRIFSVSTYDDNLYLCGDIFGVVDADPDQGTYIVGQENFTSGVIGKYNLADGSLHWATYIVTTEFIGPRKIIPDESGVYVNGYVAGSADFQPGVEHENRTTDRIDAFVSRYSADGQLDWVKTLGSPGYAVAIAATTTDDGYYLGGLFGDSVNFDPYEGSVVRTSVGTEDIFIASYRREKKDKKIKKEKVSELLTNRHVTKVTVFPNPVETSMSIDWKGFDSNEPIHVNILDNSGQPVETLTLSVENRTLDLARLPRGDYFLHVRQRDLVSIQRFLKN